MKKYAIINGANLNLLGEREPEIYGSESLEDIITHTEKALSGEDVCLDWFQSNIEGEIVNKIQEMRGQNYQGLVINPGGYSHTSVVILDALKTLEIPKVEVHLSPVHSREEFRQQLITAGGVDFLMAGFGKNSYINGIKALIEKGQ